MTNEDTLRSIGRPIAATMKRDAVHIAVSPVRATVACRPGERVRLNDDGEAVPTAADDAVGIIDPFLTAAVSPGAIVWLFLMPGSITSLTHLWSHPVLDTHPAPSQTRDAAIAWMRAWAIEHTPGDYYDDGPDERVTPDTAYAFAIEAGHTLHIGPYESARDAIDDTWWTNWAAITGKRGQPGEYFSCAC